MHSSGFEVGARHVAGLAFLGQRLFRQYWMTVQSVVILENLQFFRLSKDDLMPLQQSVVCQDPIGEDVSENPKVGHAQENLIVRFLLCFFDMDGDEILFLLRSKQPLK